MKAPPSFRVLIGIAILLIAFLLSSNRKKIDPRVILGGLALQFMIAFGVLRVAWVETFFGWVAQLFSLALQISIDAAGFVFGPLSNIDSYESSV